MACRKHNFKALCMVFASPEISRFACVERLSPTRRFEAGADEAPGNCAHWTSAVVLGSSDPATSLDLDAIDCVMRLEMKVIQACAE